MVSINHGPWLNQGPWLNVSENLCETVVSPVVTPLMSESFTTYYSHVRALGFRGMYETLL